MIDYLQKSANVVEKDLSIIKSLDDLQYQLNHDIDKIYNTYIRGIKIWEYQDFSAPISTNLTITGFFNGSGLSFISGYIIDSSAVIVKQDNNEKPLTTTNNILTQWMASNRVKVASHIQTNVSLNQVPASDQNGRLYFIVQLPQEQALPSGYEQAPSFVRTDRVEFLDSAYVNQYDNETIYGIKTFNSKMQFGDAPNTRVEMGLGSAAVREEDFFATYYELTGTSGVLDEKISSTDVGVSQINNISGSVSILSSDETVSINVSGQSINLKENPQNVSIYRNEIGEITGLKYNANIGNIVRTSGQISGIVFSNYSKTILRDNNNNITGIKITNF